jgi:hypothetical protein
VNDAADADDLVCSIPRTRGALRVMRRTYKGVEFADVRTFYLDATDGTLRPGKGATVRPNELREVIAALTQIADAFEAEAD